MTALIFLDTETTGLETSDDVWEFGAIRREPDGTETEHHLFVEHDPGKCALLPGSFRADHYQRFPGASSTGCSGRGCGVVSRDHAAGYIEKLTEDRPHIIGAVPNFDTERLSLLLERHGCKWNGHYHLTDVENLAVGYLARMAASMRELLSVLKGIGIDAAVITSAGRLERLQALITPPWDSDELSRAVGVEPPGEGVRHTAMGDVLWCRELHDAIMGVRPSAKGQRSATA